MSPLEEILQFVLSLQDEYGFLIDIKHLKTCLSSVNDITDLEEVLYRLQALILISHKNNTSPFCFSVSPPEGTWAKHRELECLFLMRD